MAKRKLHPKMIAQQSRMKAAMARAKAIKTRNPGKPWKQCVKEAWKTA